MINRIRDVRREKGLTLAEGGLRCDPPTTAQTIGRLETGMRNLSLDCCCAARDLPSRKSWRVSPMPAQKPSPARAMRCCRLRWPVAAS